MKIVITIGDFKVEVSGTSEHSMYHSWSSIKDLITSVVNDYNKTKQ